MFLHILQVHCCIMLQTKNGDAIMKKRSVEIKTTNEKDVQRRIHMATQIAATPIIRGEEAKSILKQMEQKPNEAAKLGAKKILELFEKK